MFMLGYKSYEIGVSIRSNEFENEIGNQHNTITNVYLQLLIVIVEVNWRWAMVEPWSIRERHLFHHELK